MNIVAIIQARMGSTRLPGKVLMPILGQPLLDLLVSRVKRSTRIDRIVIATTTETRDDQLAERVAGLEGVALFRGSEDNVLKRFAESAKFSHADIVVRITADNPFFDWRLADQAITRFIAGHFDYLSTPGYPYGIGIEVFTSRALFRADEIATDAYDREHVTAYFYRNPQLFKLGELRCAEALSHVRLTVDTPEDIDRARSLFEEFGAGVTFREVVDAGR